MRDLASPEPAAPPLPAIAPEASVREALDRMLATGTTRLAAGSGTLTLDAVRDAARLPDA